MDYVIALIGMPLLMVFWVLVQRWTADDPDVERVGRCMNCTCGKGLDEECERRLSEAEL